MSLEDNQTEEQKTGTVYLVGAGPSDVELITVKGKRLLEEADVIVYDRLMGNGILMWGNEKASYINVGKTSGHHPIPQDEINRILIREAKKGRKVVRLKGGDPLVFGRGGEEAAALGGAGVSFEIVPGITSAVAVPAYLGIPVTHRDLASSVHIVTAHKKDGTLPDIRYRALTEGGGTLVFLMGLHTIRAVMEGLLREGIEPDLPAAVLERGTTARQRKIVGTVGNIAALTEEASVRSPAIILVGHAADFTGMEWFDRRPLAGVKIAVTRPKERISRLSSMLREKGAEVLELPSIRVVPVEENEKLSRELEQIGTYTWLVFTSPSGVRIFRRELSGRKVDVRSLSHLKIAVIGEGSRRELEEWGLFPDLVPDVYDGEHLGSALAERIRQGEKVLLPRARAGGRKLVEKLQEAGAVVTDLPTYDTLYDTCPYVDYEEEFFNGGTDYVMFTSASTVRGFVKSAPSLDFSKVTALCIGQMTCREARDAGMKTYTAREATLDSLVELAIQTVREEKEYGKA